MNAAEELERMAERLEAAADISEPDSEWSDAERALHDGHAAGLLDAACAIRTRAAELRAGQPTALSIAQRYTRLRLDLLAATDHAEEPIAWIYRLRERLERAEAARADADRRADEMAKERLGALGRARAAELRAQAKPERVEVGQRWRWESGERVESVDDDIAVERVCHISGGTYATEQQMLTSPKWRYLWKEGE